MKDNPYFSKIRRIDDRLRYRADSIGVNSDPKKTNNRYIQIGRALKLVLR